VYEGDENMSLLTTAIKNDVLTITMCSRIDAKNVNELQNEINEALEGKTVSSVVMDAKELEYISSIGLRLMLGVKKRIQDFKIINVSDNVYDIFEMTKFTDIMSVQKAHRSVSVEGCPVIGKGACGTVYKLDDETIVKVFVDGYELEKIEMERDHSRNAFTHGVDTAIPFDIVKVGDQYGLVYEIINADTLKNVMLRERDKLEYYMGIYAAYVKNMHTVCFDGNPYPDMKKVWIEKINALEGVFTEEEKAAAKKLISEIPDEKNFNHGDMNLGNLMVEGGKAVLIDMEDAVLGHPIFDVAFIYYLIKLLPGFLPSEQCELITGFTKDENVLLWNKFCEVYFDSKTAEERAVYEKQIHPYGIIKLMEVIPFYYSIFDAAEGENKKTVPALYAAFRPAVEDYKKELLETAQRSGTLLPPLW
jgi:uncharacterized protein (TIGR02172 family)